MFHADCYYKKESAHLDHQFKAHNLNKNSVPDCNSPSSLSVILFGAQVVRVKTNWAPGEPQRKPFCFIVNIRIDINIQVFPCRDSQATYSSQFFIFHFSIQSLASLASLLVLPFLPFFFVGSASQRSARPNVFLSHFLLHVTHRHCCSHSCLLLSRLLHTSRALLRQCPVGVCYMNQQYPAHPSHSLCCSHSLEITEVWFWMWVCLWIGLNSLKLKTIASMAL